MALLADAWHMSSHAVAIGLSAFASAIFLLGVATRTVVGSVGRL